MNDMLQMLRSIEATDSFNSIGISIASPSQIRSWSYGEVRKPETINYRTLKPEKDGLFCARIFGPEKDYECLCGKYKRIKYKGIVCEKCGVEVTLSRVRRERMGHINLAAPVAHIWFLRTNPSRIGYLLELANKDLEKILYFEAYIVLDPGLTKLKHKQILSEAEYDQYRAEYGPEAFTTGIGAEALEHMLRELNIDQEFETIYAQMNETTSEVKRAKLLKRLKVVDAFRHSGVHPEWMILNVLPVIPPGLRPLVQLDGGRFATSDLNDLYRRVINRNNRLHRLIDLGAPEIIMRNEKRMLQESVDNLLDNSRSDRSVLSNMRRPLKSLADMLKGKQGRFRQNLLGKRVDYSGRSVITVGPNLEMHQCGLPKSMAKELFKPFIYAKLLMYNHASTLKVAKHMVEEEDPVVWDIVEEVIYEHPVLLNRAPTLHRLGIQAFEPKMIEGKAIRLHPLVCVAFNADFDGDQMAVHVPLSLEAQLEARILMMSTKNILAPSNGRPIISPTQDIVLGMYFLSMQWNALTGDEVNFTDFDTFKNAYERRLVDVRFHVQDKAPVPENMGVEAMYKGIEDNSIKTYKYSYLSSFDEINYTLMSGQLKLQNPILIDTEIYDGKTISVQRVKTTPGRMLIYNILRNTHIPFSFINRTLTKNELGQLIDLLYRYDGPEVTVRVSDQIKNLGFTYAALSGISFGKDDLIIPDAKEKLVDETLNKVKKLETQYLEGFMTYQEKYNKVIDVWTACSENVAKAMMLQMEQSTSVHPNSVFMMANSGARSSETQLRQLAGMRGLMATPNGEIIETPIISNFKEGLSELEYFNSTHGARKGLADTALKTANSGYLTRRLVDVAQEIIIREEDCGTDEGLVIEPLMDGGDVIESIKERVLGRTLLKNVQDLKTGEIIGHTGEIVDESLAERIEKLGLTYVEVRSPLFCKLERGLCAKCYGRDLARGVPVRIGEAVGVVAAQSIGEPGTQLTMRTFHIGGAAQGSAKRSRLESSHKAKVKLETTRSVVNSKKHTIIMNRRAQVKLVDENGVERAQYRLPYGATLMVKNGANIAPGDTIVEWDPYTIPIISDKEGTAQYVDLIEGATFEEVMNEATGIANRVVIGRRNTAINELRPSIVLKDENGDVITLPNGADARYLLMEGAILAIDDGAKVKAGDTLSRIPSASSKTRDITGGLPRISELFEARKPKDSAIIANIDGTIVWGKDYKTRKRIIIKPKDSSLPESIILVPKDYHILVQDQDYVNKGEKIVDGDLNPHDILAVLGKVDLVKYLLKEIQSVYHTQGVHINDKHFEIIIRQMLQKYSIVSSGDSLYLPGDQMDRQELIQVNKKLVAKGKEPAKYVEILQGITRASLNTKSFISAASFQETTRILTDAAVNGKEDTLTGLKENVIVGRLISAGTGIILARNRDKINAPEDTDSITE